MAWYNASWLKRKKITLTGGASGAQTDYQIKLTVAYDSDMKSDFSDLRFTKADGTTLVDAWLETYTASTSATVWVEFTTTPADAVTEDYYMYYGNSEASSAWNMDDTFLFADDFPGTAIDTAKWTVQAGAVEVSGGNLVLTSTTGTNGLIDGKTAIPINSAIHTRAHTSSNNVQGARFNGMRGSGAWTNIMGSYMRYTTGQIASQCFNAGSGTTTNWAAVYTPTSWHIYKTTWKSGEGKFYQDDTLRQTITSNVPTVDLVANCIEGSAGGYVNVDWIFVTKFVSDPATYGFGSEESDSSWDNSSWMKRKKIILTGGASGAQTDHQIKLTIPYDSDMESDFSDLRFTTSTGDVLIGAWLETYTVSTSAAVWVKFPTTPANTVTEYYYMYYGNSAAASDWNFDNTFIFGDPFDNTTLNTERWPSIDGAPVYSIDATSHYLEVTDMAPNWNNGKGFHSKALSIPSEWIVEDAYSSDGMRQYQSNTTNIMLMSDLFSMHNTSWSTANYGVSFMEMKDSHSASAYVRTYVGVGGTPDYDTGNLSTPRTNYTRMWKTSGNIHVELNSTERVNETNSDSINVIHLGLGRYSTLPFGTARFYAFKVRKYATSPATYEFGSVESSGTAMWYYKLIQRRNR